MSHHPHSLERRYSTADWNTLHEQALREAQALRRAAWADFWRGTDHICSAGIATAQRSAQRLTHSLSRHAQLRGTPVQAK
ncbi:MAG: hypothetical protein K2X75_11705 [Burkholderiaceae bacterium]|nr:hypothetical protein [Burkholderiaceae bacterium]